MSDTIEKLDAVKPAIVSRRRAWLITILLLMFMLLNFADKSVLGFAGVRIQHDLHISPEQFGLVQSGFFWLFAVGAIVFGALSTKIGMRWLLAILMLIWVATMVPLLGPVSFGVLLMSRVILGFAEGPAYALATHSVHSWFPAEKRALPGSVVTAGASIGPLLAAPLLTWVIVTWSWHAAFGVVIALGLVWTVVWLICGRNAPEHAADEPEAADGSLEPALVANQPVDAPYRALIMTGTVVGIALLTFFSYWSTSLKVAWLPVYLTEGLGYNTITVGRLMMLPYAVAALGAIGSGLLSNRLVARGVSRRIARGYLAGGLVVLSGLSMVGFTQVSSTWAEMALITVAFSMNSAAYAVAFTAVADVVPAKKRGPILSGMVAFYSMAGVIAPLVLGYFVGAASTKADGYGMGFAVTGVLMVVGGLFATFLVRPERDLDSLRIRFQEVKA